MTFASRDEFVEYARKHLPATDEAAEANFKKFGSIDPFPDISPALLNSKDIFKYVAATGMIFPFNPDRLKGASYPVKLKGKYVYWDERGKQREGVLDEETDKLILKPNSLIFVSLEPTFRIPNYIALRFNLKISHVYKGLLLGTGPLVDPGFVGKLSLPLHNFTTNCYTLYGGMELIFMEFTKISSFEECKIESDAKGSIPKLEGFYVNFKVDKTLNLIDYIKLAVNDQGDSKKIKSDDYSVQNAVAHEVLSMQHDVEEMRKAVTTVNRIRRWGPWGSLAIFIAICALVIQVVSVLSDANSYVRGAEKNATEYYVKMLIAEEAVKQYEAINKVQQQKLEELENRIQILLNKKE